MNTGNNYKTQDSQVVMPKIVGQTTFNRCVIIKYYQNHWQDYCAQKEYNNSCPGGSGSPLWRGCKGGYRGNVY